MHGFNNISNPIDFLKIFPALISIGISDKGRFWRENREYVNVQNLILVRFVAI